MCLEDEIAAARAQRGHGITGLGTYTAEMIDELTGALVEIWSGLELRRAG